jgi:hypothetical protein
MGFHVVKNAGICCRRKKGMSDNGAKHFPVEFRLRYVLGYVVHNKPYGGDNGIIFEPKVDLNEFHYRYP